MPKPTYEVEQKFRVSDLDRVLDRARQLGAEVGDLVEQADTYFTHPCRDYSVTDEALRIRRVGERNRVTYKGPKIDTATKTRREIELPLPEGQVYAGQFAELLTALGFCRVTVVHKQRRTATITWRGQQIEMALDEVAHVGTFVELELPADDSTIATARDCILSLATKLQLVQVELRSYLEMLLESIG